MFFIALIALVKNILVIAVEQERQLIIFDHNYDTYKVLNL